MRKAKRGDVFSIDLGDGSIGYSMALTPPLYVFFGCRTPDVVPLLEVLKFPISFRCCVYDNVVKSGRWKLIGSSFPDPSLDEIVFFRKDLLSGSIETYNENGLPSRKISADEARLLEPAAVWTGDQIEDRLKDHFAGKPNQWLEALMP
ncbi:Imm26 family immunity protein [Rhizobium sp.]|uniref:Imm26 family immunity protein n=1 Tax=Rhizobium sp. TaxID=391 RepID=UPI00289FAE3D